MGKFVNYLAAFNLVRVYCSAGARAYIENVFPPSPSDVMLGGVGSLAGIERGDFTLSRDRLTIGSRAGFLTVYKVSIDLTFAFWKPENSNSFRLRKFIMLKHGLRRTGIGE